MKPGRGGRRVGAGRKPIDGATLEVTVTARVSENDFDFISQMGDGVFAVGLRKAIKELRLYQNSGTVHASLSRGAGAAGGERGDAVKPAAVKVKFAGKVY